MIRFFQRFAFVGSILVSFGSPASAAEPSPTRILLLGDSTVINSYLPDAERSHRVLERELRRLKPNSRVEVINGADNGEFIARYLLSGAYEQLKSTLPAADIIVIRFGANDEKRVDPEEFGRQLAALVKLLQADFPGAQIILETGVYMDPAHYTFDRNRTLLPYWQKARELAKSLGIVCSDAYAAMERETRSGNWDLRIRKAGKGQEHVIDAREDAGKESDLAWFSDIHPNAEGVRVASRELAEKIAELYPNELPSTAIPSARTIRSPEQYIALLDFNVDRLKEVRNPPWRKASKKNGPLDELQQSVK